ncbi:putative Low-density lipoprotein receptor domain class A [Trichinella spiralis]|uniref:putative Low-density lipoprotein receptor domain class A n=1 Tax=Trichinella spiralis TaxID=6334 RepID=UPI0001F0EB33|nr:putative Low-density lipoprotein receptor domain class A [Trichinella spiralis]
MNFKKLKGTHLIYCIFTSVAAILLPEINSVTVKKVIVLAVLIEKRYVKRKLIKLTNLTINIVFNSFGNLSRKEQKLIFCSLFDAFTVTVVKIIIIRKIRNDNTILFFYYKENWFLNCTLLFMHSYCILDVNLIGNESFIVMSGVIFRVFAVICTCFCACAFAETGVFSIGTDELAPFSIVQGSCGPDQLFCDGHIDNGKCIPKKWVCDQEYDCIDQTDETPEKCPPRACSPEQFTCLLTGHCIPLGYRCDLDADCGVTVDGRIDRSDEENEHCLQAFSCLPNFHRCSTVDVCIELVKFCDDRLDCPDGSDEGPFCSGMMGWIDSFQLREKRKNDCALLILLFSAFAGRNITCTYGQKPTPDGGMRCYCPPGKKPRRGQCIKPADEPATILITNGAAVLITDLNFNIKGTIEGRSLNPLDFDHRNRTVCWIAKDWINGNWYFIDDTYDRLFVCTATLDRCVTLLSGTLDKPKDIAIDPREGYIFITDWGSFQPSLVRVNMDGSNLTRFVDVSVIYPHGVVLDYATHSVYWLDNYLQYVRVVDYERTSRPRTVLSGMGVKSLHSLALFEKHLYATDYFKNMIVRIAKADGSTVKSFARRDFTRAYSIKIFHRQRQPDAQSPASRWPRSSCAVDNGGCDQICVPTGGGRGGTDGVRCLCAEGYKLQWEAGLRGVCRLAFSYPTLLFGRTQPGAILGIPATTLAAGYSTVRPVRGIGRPTAITADAIRGDVYFADASRYAIYRQNLETGDRDVLVDTFVGNCAGMSIDWVAGNLYWTDDALATISVLRVDQPACRRVLLSSGALSHPRAICVHPAMGLLFWADWSEIVSAPGASVNRPAASIERANMDGTGRRPLVRGDHQLHWPNGLTLDYTHHWLYWCDAFLDRIERIRFDGSDRQLVLTDAPTHPYGLAVFDGRLHWTEFRHGTVMRVALADINPATGLAKQGAVEGSGYVMFFLLQAYPKCHPTQFTCTNKQCLSMSYVCDGDRDCRDGSDELHCDFGCVPGEEFRCTASSPCISSLYKCDGYPDCADGSDELGCVKDSNDCGVNQFHCLVSGECIRSLFHCDGDVDCLDGSDEQNCSRESFIFKFQTFHSLLLIADFDCPPSLFTCNDSSRCLLKSLVCDGNAHCEDGSDESFCGNLFVVEKQHCVEPNFACLNDSSTCLPLWKLCNRVDDCADGSDEGGMCSDKQCSHGNLCDQLCYDSPYGFVCSCRDGYFLQPDKKTCSPRDPCTQWGVCSQHCQSQGVHYYCYCEPGYVLSSNKFSCKSAQPDTPFVMFSSRHEIRLIGLRRDAVAVSLVSNLRNSIAVDFYYNSTGSSSLIFWTDISTDRIYRGHMSSTELSSTLDDVVAIVQHGVATAEGIAVDWIGQNLYWVDSTLDQIEVCKFDGTYRTAIVSGKMQSLRSLAVDPRKGLLFWTDWEETNPRIERSTLAGTERVHNLLSVRSVKGGGWVNGLTIDYIAERLYWTDAKSDSIHTVNYDGQDHHLVLSNHDFMSHPFAITVFEDFVYWTDWRVNSVVRANKWNGSSVQIIQGTNGQPFDLEILHPSRQPRKGKNPCGQNNGGCSHLCLLVSDQKAVCKCPYFYKLASDMRTCVDIGHAVIVAQPRRIVSMVGDMSEQNLIPIMTSVAVENVTAMDVDPITRQLYWSDSKSATIYRAFLNGSSSDAVINSDLNNVFGLAIDWISRNLYFSSYTDDHAEISITSLDGVFRRVLIQSTRQSPGGVVKPISLAVHPLLGKMYWIDVGLQPKAIQSAKLNGDSIQPLNIDPTYLGDPSYLRIDLQRNLLYWIDRKTFSLHSINLINDQKSVFSFPDYVHPTLMDLVENDTFYIFESNRITAADPAVGLVTLGSSELLYQVVRKNTSEVTALRTFLPNSRLFNGQEMQLLYCQRGKIAGVNERGLSTLAPVSGVQSPTSLDFLGYEDRIYWTDTAKNEIVSMKRDLSGRMVIFSDRNARLAFNCSDLELDTDSKSICWLDQSRSVIACSAYDGSGVHVMHSYNSNISYYTAFTMHNNRVYWSDRNMQDGSIMYCDSQKRFFLTIIKTTKHQLKNSVRDLKVFDVRTQSGSNACMLNNGGCEHLCLYRGRKRPHLCMCSFGKLQPDNRTCAPYESFLVYSKVQSIVFGYLDERENQNAPYPPMENERFIRNVVGLAYDSQFKRLFYSDIKLGSIFMVNITANASIDKSFVELVSDEGSIEGLAFDNLHQDLYWTSYTNATINRVHVGVHAALPRRRTKVLQLNPMFDKPRGIAVDPCEMRLFWANWNPLEPSIETSYLSGAVRRAIITTDIRTPNSIAIDFLVKELYWSDARLDKIERCRYDGSGRVVVVVGKPSHPFGLAIYKDYLYWTDWVLRAVVRVEKFSGAGFTFVQRNDHSQLMAIIAVANDSNTCKSEPYSFIGRLKFLFVFVSGNVDVCSDDSANKCSDLCLVDSLDMESDCNPNTEFSCSSGQCIPIELTCNGVPECRDGDDERAEYCTSRDCPAGFSLCDNGMCIEEEKLCDGVNDCGDLSDENNCPIWSFMENRCTTANSLPSALRTIGSATEATTVGTIPTKRSAQVVVCFTNSTGFDDLHLNIFTTVAKAVEKCTSKDSFMCRSQKKCIPRSWRCDGERDCADGSDEEDCGELDESQQNCDAYTEFKCRDNSCIARSWLCDGTPDCSDGDDEYPIMCALTEECEEFKCANGKCLPYSKICNYKDDCGDSFASDERNCSYLFICLENEIQCKNGMCLLSEFYCDGDDDCGDGTDEPETCALKAPTCKSNQYECTNGVCIDESLTCNGQNDCGDWSDEGHLCNVNECAFLVHMCEHVCVDKKIGYECACNSGFRLAEDRTSCVDIDECTETYPCSQTCYNRFGSFSCECISDGYVLDADGVTCKHTDDIAPELLVCSRSTIKRYGMQGEVVGHVLINLTNAIAIDYDFEEDRVYWSDISQLSVYIGRVFLNGTGWQILHRHDLRSPDGLAVDWVARNLYWCDKGTDTIEVSRLDGQYRKVLLKGKPLKQPRAIVVDPLAGYLFWSDWGLHAHIGRMDLDGSNVMLIVTDSLKWPNALTLDYVMKRVFWGDAGLNYIGMASYDGNGVRKVITFQAFHAFGMYLFEDFLYWTDWETGTVQRVQKHSGQNRSLVIPQLPYAPMGITVVHPASKPKAPAYAPCRRHGMCAALCLGSRNESKPYTCDCPNGFKKQSDNDCAADCKPSHFVCTKTFKCIPSWWRCDGQDDCGDGQDELYFVPNACPAFHCLPGQYACSDGSTCLNANRLCDGKIDCPDGGDEGQGSLTTINCTTYDCVAPGQWKCYKSSICIAEQSFCDGVIDCPNGEDESNCTVKVCGAGYYQCPLSRICIPYLAVCDGQKDCKNGEDELNCRNRTCSSDEFRCPEGRCIPKSWHCDGEKECLHGEDELNCSNGSCGGSSFPCKGDGRCIPKSWHCDGYPDCTDYSDELNCTRGGVVCGLHEWTCHDRKQCIMQSLLCDGERDCDDGSDETAAAGCLPGFVTCRSTQFACKNGIQCIPKIWKCDGEADCSDKSDEIGCETDRCSAFGLCSQKCELSKNGRGAKCYCAAGYSVDGNNPNRCRADGSLPALLVVANEEIRSIDPYTKFHYDRILMPNSRVTSLDYHIMPAEVDGTFSSVSIYWTDAYNGTVSRKKIIEPGRVVKREAFGSAAANPLDSSDTGAQVLLQGLKRPVGIAVDWLHDHIYWSDLSAKLINIASLDGSVSIALVRKNLAMPYSLAISTTYRMLFWTDTGQRARIESAALDGTGRRILVADNLYYPTGLSVDEPNERLYWADPKTSSIETAQLDGRHRHLVRSFEYGEDKPWFISVFEDIVYFSTYLDSKVKMISKYGNESVQTLLEHDQIFHSGALVVFHPSKQLTSVDDEKIVCKTAKPCPPGTLCVTLDRVGRAFTCLCPNDMFFDRDTGKCDFEYQEVNNGTQTIGVVCCPLSKTDVVVVDDCTLRCLNDGKCVLNVNREQICHCKTGYSGDRCQNDLCYMRCPAEYDGNRCERYKCTGLCEHGTCFVDKITGNPSCRCMSGWTGEKCDVRIDICNDYCFNHGKCQIQWNHQPICFCTPPYHGDRCRHCGPLQCFNGGHCAQNRCQCKPGYSGMDCGQDLCDDFCKNGGECLRNESMPRCICPTWFAGDRCMENRCDGYCKNGGTCKASDVDGSLYCVCPTAYTGKLCETPLTCEQYCYNGGTCFKEGDDLFCKCARGYFGERCATALPCHRYCANNASCSLSDRGIPSCRCTRGLTGTNCMQFYAKSCEEVDCHHGYCKQHSDDVNRITCACKPGWFGIVCNLPTCHLFCLNGGTCRMLPQEAVCSCPLGTGGNRCEYKLFDLATSYAAQRRHVVTTAVVVSLFLIFLLGSFAGFVLFFKNRYYGWYSVKSAALSIFINQRLIDRSILYMFRFSRQFPFRGSFFKRKRVHDEWHNPAFLYGEEEEMESFHEEATNFNNPLYDTVYQDTVIKDDEEHELLVTGHLELAHDEAV